jgi:hypothetical protein
MANTRKFAQSLPHLMLPTGSFGQGGKTFVFNRVAMEKTLGRDGDREDCVQCTNQRKCGCSWRSSLIDSAIAPESCL